MKVKKTWLKIRYLFWSYFGLLSEKRTNKIEKEYLERPNPTQTTRQPCVVSFDWGDTHPDNSCVFTPDCVAELSGEGVLLFIKKEITFGYYWSMINNVWTRTDVSRDYQAGMIYYDHEQLYGTFSVRVIMPDNIGSWVCPLWLINHKKTPPEINGAEMFWYSKKDMRSFRPGLYMGDSYEKSTHWQGKLTGKSLASRDVIFTVVWTPDTLSYLINGCEVYRLTGDVPSIPMAVCISTGGHINHPFDDSQLPASMVVKWFRAFENN